MNNKKGILVLFLMAIINFIVLSWFSVSSAAFATVMGLFFSFVWFLIFAKILDERTNADGTEQALSVKDYFGLYGPGGVFYLTVWVVAVGVYILT